MNSLTRRLLAASLLATAAHATTAALLARGGGMVYDSDQNITWLQDFGAGGMQYWQGAVDWADNLAHGGYTDWRLPHTMQPDPGCSYDAGPGGGAPVQSAGYGCTGSEMGYLFYNHLGGNDGESVLDLTGDSAQEIANLALFQNIQAYHYHSGTSYAPSPAALAWSFGFGYGFQSVNFKVPDGLGSYAVAVRDGDVANAVPEPSGLALVLAALGGLLVAGAARPSGQRHGALTSRLCGGLSATVCASFLLLAQPAAADQSLETALGLSMDQAHAVMAIEKQYRLAFAAKRGDFNRESRVLRRAHIARDSGAIARQEPVVAALQEELRRIRDAENDKIRAVLTPAQRARFEDVLVQRKAMRGSSRDENLL